MITRVRATLTGMTALAALVLFVGGLPVVLYRFGGSPLPGHVIGWHHLAMVLSRPDEGSLLLAVVRAAAWLAWLLFTACVLVEAHAVVRDRKPPHLRLGGLQGAAANLVALAAFVFVTPAAVSLSASVTSVGHLPALSVASGHLTDGYDTPLATIDAITATPNRLIAVRVGDCLWSLAQRYLGAGDRYPEIAALNYGREMGDGKSFTNPALIQPGWQLLLPGTTTMDSNDSGWARSNHLGHPTADATYRRRHAAAWNRAHQIVDGVGLLASAGTQAARLSDRAEAEPIPVKARDESVGKASRELRIRASASVNPEADQLASTTIFVSGALAGAVLTSLGRMRHRQRQERRRGRRIVLPGERHSLATEQRLRTATYAEQQLGTLGEALACLASGIFSTGQELPDIVGVHVTPDLLEVLLAQPATDRPPAPYSISPGRQGMCWQLDLPAHALTPGGVDSDATGRGPFLPGLITAGATEAGYLLIDVESVQVMALDGPATLVDEVVATIALELAAGQWSGWYELLLVGCDGLSGLGCAEHCATLDAAIDLLQVRCAAVERRIAELAPRSVRELRLAEPDNEDWTVTILVSSVEPTPAQMLRLLQLAEDGPGGIAVIVAGDIEAADGRMSPTVLQLAPDSEGQSAIVANLVPLQIKLWPRALSVADYDAIGALFTSAANLDDVGKDQSPYAAYFAAPWVPMAASLGPQMINQGPQWATEDPAAALRPTVEEHQGEPDWAAGEDEPLTSHVSAAHTASGRLDVRILGPFTICGAAEALQPKQAELVLALALAAPGGLSNSALCSMLGADPDHPKPTDSVRQIITRTRRRLGLASDGQPYIIHAGNGRYVLHPDVGLDWSSFRRLINTGDIDDLRAAVSLITGEPFAGGFFWWIDIPLVETVRAELVDAAETLAEFELDLGAPRAAARAARAGLMAEESAEQLWRLIMRAEHAVGNLAGVAEAWHHCLYAIDDVAPGGEPHPETASLYRQLTMPERQHAPAAKR